MRIRAVQKRGELAAQERAALTLWLLLQSPMSTAEVAQRCGMSDRGALSMIHKMSRVVPVAYEAGRWYIEKG